MLELETGLPVRVVMGIGARCRSRQPGLFDDRDWLLWWLFCFAVLRVEDVLPIESFGKERELDK